MAGPGFLKWLAGAAVAVAVLCCAPVAGAGVVVQNGITYQNSTFGTISSPTGGNSFACASDHSPLGGGVVHNGESDILLTQLGYVNAVGTDDILDSWLFTFRNAAVVDKTRQMSVICDQTSPKYVEETAPAPAQARTKETAYCSSKRHVYGGGVRSDNPSDTYLASSYPVDGPDRDKKPDDGWRGSIDGADSTTTSEIRVTAACGRKLPAYKSATVEIDGGGLLTEIVICPASKINVISGGAKLPGAFGVGRTSASYPLMSGTEYDSWDAEAYNTALSPAKMTTFAVCVAGLFEE